jgi:hypothetical protein
MCSEKDWANIARSFFLEMIEFVLLMIVAHGDPLCGSLEIGHFEGVRPSGRRAMSLE